ncbi:MAG: 1-deoxy-D-xylulose-5-phosphate reductoisomerase [Clostridia bacterium]
MQDVIILGATGSVGRQTRDVVLAHPDRFRAVGLAGRQDTDGMRELVADLRPRWVYLADPIHADRLRDAVGTATAVGSDPAFLADHIGEASPGTAVVAAMSGFAGLEPTLLAARRGLRICLANKETLVAAGALVLETVRQHGAALLPVDSEHSALMQAIGTERDHVARLWITCSGGPFRGRRSEELEEVSPEEALRHPTWRMGPKISVDSATLMNKGLEVLEASWLFDMPLSQIGVVVHPESIVHSMVEMTDGAVLAELSRTDMRIAIQLALTWPDRVPAPVPTIDWAERQTWHFEEPDENVFPALRLCRQAGERGGAAPTVLNAANEEAVRRFLNKEIRLPDIWRLTEGLLERMPDLSAGSLAEILEADAWARDAASRWQPLWTGGGPC